MEFETFDDNLIQMIDDIIMETQVQAQICNDRGTYTQNSDGWVATMNESTAIQEISYSEVSGDVRIQFVGGISTYTYVPSGSANAELEAEVLNVLNKNYGSVGHVFNELLAANKLTLI